MFTLYKIVSSIILIYYLFPGVSYLRFGLQVLEVLSQRYINFRENFIYVIVILQNIIYAQVNFKISKMPLLNLNYIKNIQIIKFNQNKTLKSFKIINNIYNLQLYHFLIPNC